jgi:hypothetical protein
MTPTIMHSYLLSAKKSLITQNKIGVILLNKIGLLEKYMIEDDNIYDNLVNDEEYMRLLTHLVEYVSVGICEILHITKTQFESSKCKGLHIFIDVLEKILEFLPTTDYYEFDNGIFDFVADEFINIYEDLNIELSDTGYLSDVIDVIDNNYEKFNKLITQLEDWIALEYSILKCESNEYLIDYINNEITKLVILV